MNFDIIEELTKEEIEALYSDTLLSYCYLGSCPSDCRAGMGDGTRCWLYSKSDLETRALRYGTVNSSGTKIQACYIRSRTGSAASNTCVSTGHVSNASNSTVWCYCKR